jgi:type IV pilus assembly protein PilA
MIKKLKRKKGFTLIEMIIVIAIIGIIAAIAVPKFSSIQKDAKIKADISSAKVIADATKALLAREGITEVGGYGLTTDIGDDIKGYIEVEPIPKAIKDEKFNVQINDNDDVFVTVNGVELYPIADETYSRPSAPVTPVIPADDEGSK